MPPLLHSFWKVGRGSRRETVRRCASTSLVILYTVVAVGIPLPTGAGSSKSGELFPCMDCACGCHSAKECWRSCCCHTLAERFDWAREHGVRPPEFALAEARQLGLDVSWLAGAAGPKQIGATCRVANTENCKHSCCPHHEQKSHSSAPTKNDRVIGWRALGCHGQSSDWIASVPTLIAVRLDLSEQLPRAGWLRPASPLFNEGLADNPPVPPPDCA